MLINELNEISTEQGIIWLKSWISIIIIVNCESKQKIVKQLINVFFCLSADIIDIKFEAIQIDNALVASAKTPASLETVVLKHYPLKSGEFMFLEWTKFTEDILVTSDRSALISSQTSECIFLVWFYFANKNSWKKKEIIFFRILFSINQLPLKCIES